NGKQHSEQQMAHHGKKAKKKKRKDPLAIHRSHARESLPKSQSTVAYRGGGRGEKDRTRGNHETPYGFRTSRPSIRRGDRMRRCAPVRTFSEERKETPRARL